MGELLQPSHFVIVLFASVFIVLPFWKICAKAVFPGILALLVLVPFLNFVSLLWLAFAKWPSLNRNA